MPAAQGSAAQGSAAHGSAAQTFETMGTVVSVRGVDDISAIEAVFHAADDRFSLYRDDSELSRVARGELALAQASATLRDAYALAIEWRARTAGAFTPHRPDGVIDLNGVIKARALDEAARQTTVDTFTINCGGDLIGRGEHVVGIADPDDPGAILASVRLDDHYRAMATSGTAQRGDHIWGRSSVYRQVTVIARDAITADVLATAIVAGGPETLDLALREHDVQVLAVAGGDLVGSAGFRALLSSTDGAAERLSPRTGGS